MTDSLSIQQVFDYISEIWMTPLEFWTALTKFSKILLVNFGHPILPFLKAMKVILGNLESVNPDEVVSWSNFAPPPCEEDFATTCFPSEIIRKAVELLSSCLNDDTTDNSSLLATTTVRDGTTSTSSMTAPGPQGHVDAQRSRESNLSDETDEQSGAESCEEVNIRQYFIACYIIYTYFVI